MNYALEVHSYDGHIDPKLYEYINKIIPIKDRQQLVNKFIDEVNMYALDPNKNKGRHDCRIIRLGVETMRSDEYDPRNKVDIHDVFCIAWCLCKKMEEEDLFFLQMIDMINTHGTCLQGRSARCIQIILALMEL